VTKAVLSVGSNLGDQLGYLQLALDQIASCTHTTVIAMSSVYETAPVGGPRQKDFLNAIFVIDTTLDPDELLDFVQGIEHEAQRERIAHWGPRTLDVDIIKYEGVIRDDEELRLPHPRAHERGFVLVPWVSIEPEEELSGYGRLTDLIADIDFTDVRERKDLILDNAKQGQR